MDQRYETEHASVHETLDIVTQQRDCLLRSMELFAQSNRTDVRVNAMQAIKDMKAIAHK